MNQHFEDKYFEDIEQAANRTNFFLPILKKFSSYIKKGDLVLDVGCGSGAYVSPLITLSGCELYGIDAGSSYLGLARKRGYKDIAVIEDLCNNSLPYEDATFDAIICKDVFEHLLDPIFVLSQINRILKPNGYFLWHVPNHFTMKGRLKFLFDNNIDTYRFYPKTGRWELPHIRFYTFADSIKIFESNNFHLITDYSDHFADIFILNRFNMFNNYSKRLAKRNPDNYAASITLVLRKK